MYNIIRKYKNNFKILLDFDIFSFELFLFDDNLINYNYLVFLGILFLR